MMSLISDSGYQWQPLDLRIGPFTTEDCIKEHNMSIIQREPRRKNIIEEIIVIQLTQMQCVFHLKMRNTNPTI